jgi:hypothetical protein
MKVLHFSPRRRSRATLAGRLDSVQALLHECGGRQASIREDARRLRAALRRLQGQLGALALDQSRLRRRILRLRAVGTPGTLPGR